MDHVLHARWSPSSEAWVSRDPDFTHAHVTALGPFLPDVDPKAAATVAEIAATTASFDVTMHRIATFANGCIHLVPEPEQPFVELTARLVAAFPECPPYAGLHPGSRPHLTLDLTSELVTEASTRLLLGDLLPAHFRADRLDLAWYEEGACRVLQSWKLGGAVAAGQASGSS